MSDKNKKTSIPGTAEWIKINAKKKSIYKKAYFIKTAKEQDPYAATKTVAIASSIGVPGDLAFDFTTKTMGAYQKQHGSNAFKDLIKNPKSAFYKMKTVLKSPAYKNALRDFKTEQKGFAIPGSIVMGSIPVLYSLRQDYLRAKSASEYKEVIEKTAKAKSDFQKLKDNKVPLTPEERKECMNAKAVWHFNGGSPSPAVWKSIDKTGKITYVTNTHRAYNTAPTLKGAIGRFHKFIKSTA